MSLNDLAKILNEMYSNAPEGDQVAKIHLFGVKYADCILRNNYKATEIVRLSGINQSYATEVSKGIKLSKYVVPKN
ncbi:HTH-like domain-containing protein [Gottfriedia acidiceleris]|uniref:HTH-like domain-containing protein n=1 Tax=Gottfriedia acidiceleris TaxID=371036 RepID=UPI003D25503D